MTDASEDERKKLKRLMIARDTERNAQQPVSMVAPIDNEQTEYLVDTEFDAQLPDELLTEAL